MTSSSARSLTVAVALLAEGVDRNFLGTVPRPDALKSPSSRRAWIEIVPSASRSPQSRVALLAEGVDRNDVFALFVREVRKVALLAEGVDRNSLTECTSRWSAQTSPSSRRAWIEIPLRCPGWASGRVALLAEGVDRNFLPC